ncbi:MAG: phosphoribosylpyrophosphate synthetase [Bacteroidetes bacterium]|nr:phosphoribosylpyrophosphate synthetase [Bacteroidota bacterium]
MKQQLVYNTVSEAVNALIKRGYTADFSILSEKECLVCNQTQIQLPPEQFEIDEIHRFEGNTDPGDEMIVFAISSDIFKMKGIVVNAFGVYADGKMSTIVERLHKHI